MFVKVIRRNVDDWSVDVCLVESLFVDVVSDKSSMFPFGRSGRLGVLLSCIRVIWK